MSLRHLSTDSDPKKGRKGWKLYPTFSRSPSGRAVLCTRGRHESDGTVWLAKCSLHFFRTNLVFGFLLLVPQETATQPSTGEDRGTRESAGKVIISRVAGKETSTGANERLSRTTGEKMGHR